MTADDDLRAVLLALAGVADEAARPPDAAAEARARSLLHAAVARQAQDAGAPSGWLVRLVRRGREHIGATGSALVAAAAGAVLAAGWSAPAGSPLHDVRLVRESVALHLPGADDATLVLGYAEDRLADAAAGRDPQASLEEARSLLDSCRAYLPADQADPLWQRWTRDEAELARLEAQLAPGAPGPAPVDVPSSPPAASASPSTPGQPSVGTPRQGQGDGSTTSSSTTTQRETISATTSMDGGGSDGGHDGSATTTSTATRTATSQTATAPPSTDGSHDGGGSGSDGGGSDGGSQSFSSTSESSSSH